MLRKRPPIPSSAIPAPDSTPRHWDAAAIVRLAREAGMGYLVVTTKHHDGFAMYRSTVSPYNVVDATPWHHDPVADLARECRRQGVRLCFYYSQDLDWHHPDGAWNTSDYAKEKKAPNRYLREKRLRQLTEPITRYGPSWMTWSATTVTRTPAPSATTRQNAKRLQPHCV